MDYFEKIALLDERDLFGLLFRLQVEPRWVTSAGKRSIQIIGACHHGDNHSALLDPDTLKVHCFSECGDTMLLHTFIKRALNLTNPQDAKDYIEEWIENQELDLSNRIARNMNFEYKERPYIPGKVEMVPGIDAKILDKLKSQFDCSIETLSKLVWRREDGIDPEILAMYDVAYYPPKDPKRKNDGTIILPHHNVKGEIVGLYERSFRPLRKKVKEENPEIDYKLLLNYPRAKYVPLLRDEEDRGETKTSWSFPNSQNLYGLHLALDSIREHEKAIIFEGGKSVMLSRQYGHPYAVATHTFGAHLNHISMLIAAGAKEIILAFDKQYESQEGQAWELYQRKTQDLATRVGKYCIIKRMIDDKDRPLLAFKDSPIDKGKEIFEQLFAQLETLTPQVDEKGEVIKRPLQDARLDGQIELTPEQLKIQNQKKEQSAAQEKKGLKVLTRLW